MRPLPISREEFARFFQKVKPPTGWPAHIGVAHSGGPDSTCLLFLIQQYIKGARHSHAASPSRVSSLTIDHALQESSVEMAAQSACIAAKLHIPHTTHRIPWDSPPFPPLPGESQPFENKARLARYNLFWKWMREEDIGAIGIGHHADDQVETALMRLERKSSSLGARGMLPCRRWGMGNDNDLEWLGYEGMNKWIIRPLLEVSKDRILATCEENKLNYVTDSTNFQPEVTLRNALRAMISRKDKGEEPSDPSVLSPVVQEQLEALDQTISSFTHLSVDLNSSSERLRAAVKAINVYAQDTEDQATSYLTKIRIPSPPGTFILSTRAIQNITNPLLRRAIILRILRYISFYPWGTLRAQAGRSRGTLDRLISRVWNPRPFHSPDSGAFCGGGGVLWTPVVVDTSQSKPNFLDAGGRIKRPNPALVKEGKIPLGQGDIGWLATRQPPPRPSRMKALGAKINMNVDLSATLSEGLKAWDEGKGEGPAVIEVLWDCRFLIRFDLAKMPEQIATMLLNDPGAHQIVAQGWTDYCCPKIVAISHGNPIEWSEDKEHRAMVLHSNIDSHTPSWLLQLKSNPKFKTASPDDPKDDRSKLKKRITPIRESGWIHTSWVRILDQC